MCTFANMFNLTPEQRATVKQYTGVEMSPVELLLALGWTKRAAAAGQSHILAEWGETVLIGTCNDFLEHLGIDLSAIVREGAKS